MRLTFAAVRVAASLLTLSAITWMCPPAYAQAEPPDLTPLGVHDPSYSAPFAGRYLIRYPGLQSDNISFVVISGMPWPYPEPAPPLPSRIQQPWSVPPEVKPIGGDWRAAGTANIEPPPGAAWVNGFWYAQLNCTQPGWIKVEIWKLGVLTDAVYYPLYQIQVIEDHAGAGALQGFDPRYGAASLGMSFPELGGAYDRQNPQAEPAAEDIQGYDRRFQSGGQAWNGQPGAGPQRLIPEAMVTGDSLMFTTRNEQNIRIYLKGPREWWRPPVPVILRCSTTGAGTGTLAGGSGSVYELTSSFLPHDPFGDFAGSWPLLQRSLLVENPPEQKPIPYAQTQCNGEWMLRWPAQGGLVSSFKGDIEIEAKIPNPSTVWTKYGASLGAWEGVMSGRLGTVYKYIKYDVWPSEPTDLDLLRSFWVRKVCHKFVNQPQVGTPDEATQGFGAKLFNGERDNALLLEATDELGSTPIAESEPEWRDEYEKTDNEVWIVRTNRKMASVEDPDPGEGQDLAFWFFWTRADVPPGVAEPWSATPASLELNYRSYIGAVDVDVPTSIQFDAEPTEPNGQKNVAQHFINAIADVNDDGQITDADDGDAAEEQSGPGLLINRYTEADEPNTPSHANLRPILIKLSSAPPSRAGYTLVISTQFSELSRLVFWKNATGTDPIPLAPLDTEAGASGPQVWLMSLDGVEGDDTTVYVGADFNAQPNGTMTFAIAKDPGTHGPKFERIHIDRIRYTTYRFGLDVDSNNDGSIGMQDDDLEEDMHAFAFAGSTHGVRVFKHPFLSYYSSPVVRLKTSAPGRLAVTEPGGGATLLSPAPTPCVSVVVASMEEDLPPSRPLGGGREAARERPSSRFPGGDESWHGLHRIRSIEHDPQDVGAGREECDGPGEGDGDRATDALALAAGSR